jgi:hypothetical protein
MNGLIAKLARQVDSILRHFDFRVRRTDGGMLAAVGVPRHPPGVIIMPAFVAATLVHGPATSCAQSFGWASVIVVLGVVAVVVWSVIRIRHGELASARRQFDVLIATTLLAMLTLGLFGGCGPRFALAGAVFVAIAALLYAAMRFTPLVADWFDLGVQVVVLVVVAAAVWLAGGGGDAFGQGPYRHVVLLLFPLIALATVAAYVASAAAGARWRIRYASAFRPMLRDVELFVERPEQIPVTAAQVLAAFFMTPLKAPLQLLWLPAVAVLIAGPDDVFLFAGVGLVVAWLVLVLAQLDERLHAIASLVWASFFHGAALLSSLLTIGLAAARLAGVSYVTALLDSDLWPNVALYLVAAYALTWWYDYWQGRATADRVLRMLGDPIGSDLPVVPYAIATPTTRVPAAHRVLQLHGSGRLAAVCDAPNRVFFEAYLPFDLLQRLVECGPTGVLAKGAMAQMQKGEAYGHTIGALVLAGSLGAFGLWLHSGLQSPLVVVEHDPATEALTVEDLLFDPTVCRERPVLAVTASGGGTRAATFTAAILEDLQALGLLRDVRLAGGVSGGGAALAYFAGHRPELLEEPDGGVAWEQFVDAMKVHYILDVIEGASEARLLQSTRLGNLLAESFEHHWDLDARKTLGDVRDVGLLLDAAIEGDLTIRHRDEQEENLPFEEVEYLHRKETLTTLAGGRLVLTNLRLADDYPALGIGREEHRLPIVVVRDTRPHGSAGAAGLGLGRAAAAAANFPPVFSNAAIDVIAPQPSTTAEHRYWVTDGGALENRGLESILYAVEGGLEHGLADPELLRRCGGLPSVDLVVIEASASSFTYEQSRGTNSVMAAGSTFGSQLAAELVRRIDEVYERPGAGRERRFKVHYVTMPIQLRRAGAFGTHWILQPWVTICRSEEPGPIPPGDECVRLTGAATVKALRALYDTKPSTVPRDWDKVSWLRDEREYKEEWEDLVRTLAPGHP